MLAWSRSVAIATTAVPPVSAASPSLRSRASRSSPQAVRLNKTLVTTTPCSLRIDFITCPPSLECRYDPPNQGAHPRTGLAADLDHFGVGEWVRCVARRKVGNERKPEDTHVIRTRGDDFGHCAHSDRIGAESFQHPNLCRRLVRRPGQRGVGADLQPKPLLDRDLLRKKLQVTIVGL